MNKYNSKIINFEEYKDRKRNKESIKEINRDELLELIKKVMMTK